MYIADKRSPAGWMVHVLQYENARGGNLQNGVPEVRAVVKRSALHRRFAAAEPSRHGVTDHRRRIVEHAVDGRIGKAGVPKPQVKGLHRIGHHAAVELTKSAQLSVRELQINFHNVALQNSMDVNWVFFRSAKAPVNWAA